MCVERALGMRAWIAPRSVCERERAARWPRPTIPIAHKPQRIRDGAW